jgi:predicted nucleic acid-binding protein
MPGPMLSCWPVITEAAIAALMKQYEDIRPQFADAALVYLAHREKIDTIFTLDRRDFSTYRNGRGRPFHLVPDLGETFGQAT